MKALSDYSTEELVDELDRRFLKMTNEEFIVQIDRVTDKINNKEKK